MPWDRLKKPGEAMVAKAMALVSHARPAQDAAGKPVNVLNPEALKK